MENGGFFYGQNGKGAGGTNGVARACGVGEYFRKKAKIYSRLLTDPALAKTMEELGSRREKRRESLLALAFGKESKKKNGQGRCEMNTEKTE